MFRVRPYEEKDRAALEAIYRKCRSEADWLPAAARDRCDFAGDTMGEVLYVAVGAGDDAVGFVSAWEPDGFIHHLYVRDGLKGKGIGTQLLAAHRLAITSPVEVEVRSREPGGAGLLPRAGMAGGVVGQWR
jgi:GNAT superfamily N-acetyltransferase